MGAAMQAAEAVARNSVELKAKWVLRRCYVKDERAI